MPLSTLANTLWQFLQAEQAREAAIEFTEALLFDAMAERSLTWSDCFEEA